MQYTDDPRGWAQRWRVELDASHKATEAFRAEGKEAVKRFRDEREQVVQETPQRRWNLFYSGVSTAMAMLYGQVPKVVVSRRYADAADDAARVASTMLERLLNADMDADDPFVLSLRDALQDRMLPGLGTCRVRYEVEMEPIEEQANAAAGGMDEETRETLQPEQQERKRPGSERAEVEYVHWEDFCWSAGARVWHEVEWVAFRRLMSRAQLVKRFGDVGKAVPLNARKKERSESGKEPQSPWDRAEVWEIWDKGHRCVYWLADGYPATLDKQEDPLELEGFFPCPRPLAANLTTDAYLPRADYILARDLYRQIDDLQTRIGLLVDALRVAGVYDSGAPGLKALLSSAAQNELYPVDSWAMFAEKGGIKGSVDWLPLEQIANALSALEEKQDRLKAQLYEVTGMSDILRGQGQGPGVTATEQGLKARFASARLQQLQEDFARFASDVADLRAQVICNFWEPASMVMEANMLAHPDQAQLQAAIQLLKSPQRTFRVEVRPEALALADFAQMREERMEMLTAVSTFMTAAMPLAGAMPGAMPFLLQLLQWFIAGARGARDVEGILDGAIAAARQAAMQPQGKPAQGPDPKLLLQQMKGQQDMEKLRAETQSELVRMQAEVQADAQREQNQRVQNVQEAREKKMVDIQAKTMTGGAL
jgi:hypothetical protein